MESFQIVAEGGVRLDIQELCKELNSRSSRKFSPGKMVEFSQDHYNRFRKQYDALKILESTDPNTIVLSGEDLYTGDLNFVIGMSFDNRSIVNMKMLFTDNNHLLSFERAVKECMHQLGYLSGLKRCSDSKCIMAPSTNAKKIDQKGLNLCQSCEIRLAEFKRRI